MASKEGKVKMEKRDGVSGRRDPGREGKEGSQGNYLGRRDTCFSESLKTRAVRDAGRF